MSQVSQTGSSRFQPYWVCFSAALFFFFEFIQLMMFNAIGPNIMSTFHISATELAVISDKYFLANIIFLFPAGMMLDRLSTRKIVLIGLSASVVCTFIFAWAHQVWVLSVCRFIIGVAGSFCFLSCVRLTSRWFSPKHMALIIGLTVTLAMTGGMIAQTPLTLLTTHYGWRAAVTFDASLGILLVLMVAVHVKDFPPSDGQVQASHQPQGSFFSALTQTLGRKTNWLAGLYTSFMNLPTFILGAIWGIFYLTQIQHLSRAQGSIVTLMLFFGTIIGAPTVGWCSDKLRSRKKPMIAGALLSLVLILFLMCHPGLSEPSLLFLFFGLGFTTSTQIISYPLIAESNPLTLTATAEGMASVLIMAGGYTQVFFAFLMQKNWHHTFLNHAPVYSFSDYNLAISIMPLAFFGALILSLIIKETHCEAYVDHE